MAKAKFSPIKTGYDPRTETGGSNGEGPSWLKLKPGEAVDVTALIEVDEIIACEQCAIWMEDGNSPVWVYTGPDDPFHDMKVDRRYKAFLPVLQDGEVKVWGITKTVHRQILDIAEGSGELKGMNLRIKRNGGGLSTRYSVVPKGTRTKVSHIEEVNIIPLLGPLTPEEARELIAKKLGKDSYEEVLDLLAGRAATTRRAAAAAAESEEEEEIDNLELK